LPCFPLSLELADQGGSAMEVNEESVVAVSEKKVWCFGLVLENLVLEY
jgi:hypothetical protein